MYDSDNRRIKTNFLKQLIRPTLGIIQLLLAGLTETIRYRPQQKDAVSKGIAQLNKPEFPKPSFRRCSSKQ